MALQGMSYIGGRKQMILNVIDKLPSKEKNKFIAETKNFLKTHFNLMSEGALLRLIGSTEQREELLELTKYIGEHEVDNLLRDAMFAHSKKKWVKNLREGN
jgi:hypothetical protein